MQYHFKCRSFIKKYTYIAFVAFFDGMDIAQIINYSELGGYFLPKLSHLGEMGAPGLDSRGSGLDRCSQNAVHSCGALDHLPSRHYDHQKLRGPVFGSTGSPWSYRQGADETPAFTKLQQRRTGNVTSGSCSSRCIINVS